MNKKPIVLIICVIIVIIALGLLVIYLLKGDSTDIKDIAGTNKIDEIDTPEIILSAYPQEETDDSVEINISATISGQNEIVSITTPDGKTSGYTENNVYKVDKNGEYSFTVTASNGKSVTKSINIQNISQISSDNPYIPEGFKHISGTEVDTGFVIEDKNGNQYVWVPVKNGNPVRNSSSEKYFEDDYTTSAVNNSIAKYYGFYIARYEASKKTVNGMVVARSSKGNIPWSNINYDDAFDASINTAIAFDYIDVKTALMNSYTWDSTLAWIDKIITNYSNSRNYGNYSNQILHTGETDEDIVNEIADMAGNLKEWTTERYDGSYLEEEKKEKVEESEEVIYRVVRGGSATMDKSANSRIGEKTDLQDNYWGFRIILYKE